MMLPDGYHDLPEGRVAAVVTYLEMRSRPPVRPVPAVEAVAIRRVEKPDVNSYRDLFRAVGEPWLWFSRLHLPDAELSAVLQHPQVQVYVLEAAGVAKGLLELDSREEDGVEISFFGLRPDIVGKGAGRLLMDFAIRQAWSEDCGRLFLHTCTLDHPDALSFYLRSGFKPYRRAVEVFEDPRLTGLVSPNAASHVPVIMPMR
ncbi:MAG: GNAT family N-acetyltransferase [Candidatus Solibacter usitatus]|nr:GNAT family N-acetyltransferase [Candidatus Solibacter usitatus]